VVRDALRRLEQEEFLQEQTVFADPDDAAGKILEGWASIQQGRGIGIGNDIELKEFFADIVSRGMKREKLGIPRVKSYTISAEARSGSSGTRQAPSDESFARKAGGPRILVVG
jgi:hypothetical protein